MKLEQSEYENLSNELYEEALKYYEWWINKYPEETVYGFCFYSTGLVDYTGITVFTEEGLSKVAKKYSQMQMFAKEPMSKHMDDLRWSACDSPHHMENEELFGDINEKLMVITEKLEKFEDELEDEDEDSFDGVDHAFFDDHFKAMYECFVKALNKLSPMVFDGDNKIILSVWFGDMGEDDIYYFMDGCNTEEVAERFKKFWEDE
jgi:hypothetical protein